jgi:hypothetical protein
MGPVVPASVRARVAAFVVVAAVLAVMVLVFPVGGSPAAAHSSRSGASARLGSEHHATGAQIAADLKVRAARLVKELDREHRTRPRRLSARKEKALATRLAHKKWAKPSSVRGCINKQQGHLRRARLSGKGGAKLPGSGFVSAAQIQRLVKSCLSDPVGAPAAVQAASTRKAG